MAVFSSTGSGNTVRASREIETDQGTVTTTSIDTPDADAGEAQRGRERIDTGQRIDTGAATDPPQPVTVDPVDLPGPDGGEDPTVIDPGQMPTLPAPGSPDAPDPPDIDLDDFTPDQSGPTEPDQNSRTGRTDEESSTANMSDRNATEDVQNEVIQTDVEAKETSASSTPWWDPFGFFAGEESSGGAEKALPLALFAAGGLVLYFTANS